MKWECWYRRGHQYPGAYRGHVLERAMEIIDGESRTPWVGWRCVHCGDRFTLPGEPDRYDLPLMERVEVEELPTDVREAAAVALAIFASTPSCVRRDIEMNCATEISVERAFLSVGLRWFRRATDGDPQRERCALAETLIRNGEVK